MVKHNNCFTFLSIKKKYKGHIFADLESIRTFQKYTVWTIVEVENIAGIVHMYTNKEGS